MLAELRPYQIAALDAIREAMRAGKRSVMLQLPTGGGKTLTAASMLVSALAKGSRSMFVAHRLELIDQTVTTFARLGVLSIGVIRAGDPRKDLSQPIQIASIQTLARRKQRVDGLKIIFIDEAHRAYSNSYIKYLFEMYPDAFFVGLSATPCRTDGKPLGKVFDALIHGATYSTLIEGGFIVEPMVYSTPVLPDLSSVRTVGGDYNQEDLEAAVNRRALIGNLYAEWLKRSGGRRTVAFAVSIAHSLAIVQQFTEQGVSCEHLDGTTPEDIRRAILARLASGETQVVSNVGVLCEGWDLPACKCLLLARPTKSLVLYMQMAGRILRPFEGVQPIILDHGANVDRHGMPHEDREWSLDVKLKKTGESRCKCCVECFAMIPASAGICPHCGHEYPAPPPPEAKAPDALDDVELALRTMNGDDAQMSEFRRLVTVARTKGLQPGWVMHRFKEKFGTAPTRDCWRHLRHASKNDQAWAKRLAERTPPAWLDEIHVPGVGTVSETDLQHE